MPGNEEAEQRGAHGGSMPKTCATTSRHGTIKKSCATSNVATAAPTPPRRPCGTSWKRAAMKAGWTRWWSRIEMACRSPLGDKYACDEVAARWCGRTASRIHACSSPGTPERPDDDGRMEARAHGVRRRAPPSRKRQIRARRRSGAAHHRREYAAGCVQPFSLSSPTALSTEAHRRASCAEGSERP